MPRRSICATIHCIRFGFERCGIVGAETGHGEAGDFGTSVQTELGGVG